MKHQRCSVEASSALRILPVSVVSVRRNCANRNTAPPRSRVPPPRSSRSRKACEPSPVQNIQIKKLFRTPAQYVRSSEITPASGSRMWCSTEHFRIRKCSVYYNTKFIIPPFRRYNTNGDTIAPCFIHGAIRAMTSAGLYPRCVSDSPSAGNTRR